MPLSPSAYYPGAIWEPVSYIGQASLMSAGSLGWVEHVVVGNGDPHDLFEHAPAGNRRFSHLWVAKSGQVRQFQDLRHDSWAQVAGNDSYWSVETEGFPGEPLTDAQLDALARWHIWSGTADAIATTPGQPGIGTHEMGGAAWGGHACPGPIRAAQRTEILRRAAALRTGGDMPTPADIARAVAIQPMNGSPNSLQEEVDRTYNAVIQLGQTVARIEAKLAALTPPKQ